MIDPCQLARKRVHAALRSSVAPAPVLGPLAIAERVEDCRRRRHYAALYRRDLSMIEVLAEACLPLQLKRDLKLEKCSGPLGGSAKTWRLLRWLCRRKREADARHRRAIPGAETQRRALRFLITAELHLWARQRKNANPALG